MRNRDAKDLQLTGFKASDLAEVARLWHVSWASTGLASSSDPTAEDLAERLRHESWLIRLARVEAEIVGFVASQLDDGWLRQLFVKPTAHGTGVGTHLLASAKQDMPSGFYLRTDAANRAARRFYVRQGLRLDREAPHPKTGKPTAVYLWP